MTSEVEESVMPDPTQRTECDPYSVGKEDRGQQPGVCPECEGTGTCFIFCFGPEDGAMHPCPNCNGTGHQPARTDCYGTELPPISESDGAVYAQQPAQPESGEAVRRFHMSEAETMWDARYEHPPVERQVTMVRAADYDRLQSALTEARQQTAELESLNAERNRQNALAFQERDRLREALREYGGHFDDCAGMAGALDPRCTCGFSAALAGKEQGNG